MAAGCFYMSAWRHGQDTVEDSSSKERKQYDNVKDSAKKVKNATTYALKAASMDSDSLP